jgi:hypothetical protein
MNRKPKTVPHDNGTDFLLYGYDTERGALFSLGAVYNAGISFAGQSLYTVGTVTGNIEREDFKNGRAVTVPIVKRAPNAS